MVGTGANRMPLTKVHPILLGKQQNNDSGNSLLAQHRQMHNERMQQQQRPPGPGAGQGPPMPPGHMGGQGPPPGQYGNQFNQQQQHYPPPPQNQGYNPYNQQQPNMHHQQQQRPPMPPSYQQQQPPPPQFGNQPPQPPPPQQQGNVPVKKRKRSRWGAKEDKVLVTGPVTLPADMSEEQRKNYLLQFKIEEITQKLRTGELGISPDPGNRSPSPEPIYNSEGKRLNTREYRVRKKLEEERHSLIKEAVDQIPNYKPPADYKPPAQKINDKVFIPAERNPAVNFIGLLIGPRGNTLKRLEQETGCKIIIRGKGSVKEGKVGRVPGQLMPGEDEPLHALITGPTAEDVKRGVKVVGDIVKEGIECPDAANELRRNQLRELAELNGTLVDEEIIKCKNCGATDHRHWECQEQKNITSQITCNKCGGYGHVAADCQVRTDPHNTAPIQTFSEKAKMDNEYMSLMAELGVDAPPPAKKPPPPSLPEPPKETVKPPEPQNFAPKESKSKWGPPPGSSNQKNSGPKSLMDMNFSGKSPGGSNFRGERPPQPRGQSPGYGGGAPWQQQNRPPFGQRPGGPPPGNAPPWQQNGPPPRGPPNNYNMGPQGGNQPPPPIMGQPPPPWAQQPQTAYPGQQWGQQPYYGGGYNPYQQPPQQQPYAPPPPWAQQPPPPPPPPPEK